MLRVYLDQAHWINLTKARVGHKDGSRHNDALLLLREAVGRDWVSCPLSMQHFMETQHRSDWKSRLQLVETMLELSRWHTIAHQRSLVGTEIDRALREMFGRPAIPRTVQVFGVGPNHAMGRQIADYEPPDDAPLTSEQRAFLRQLGSRFKQNAILAGVPRDLEPVGYNRAATYRAGEMFAAEQERIRDVRRVYDFHTGDRGRRATSVDVYIEFEKTISEALELAGLHWGYLYDSGEAGMEKLIRLAPTVLVHRELRRLRHEASEKAWEPSDLVDLTALSSAIVYCDVVVTERVWTALAARARLGEKHRTAVVRSLDDLKPHLISAAVAA
jgi:hypothetical protein